jgi:hypothetical protein
MRWDEDEICDFGVLGFSRELEPIGKIKGYLDR